MISGILQREATFFDFMLASLHDDVILQEKNLLLKIITAPSRETLFKGRFPF